MNILKKLFLGAGLICLALGSALGQARQLVPTSLPTQSGTNLTKFDLDFRGGTPKELVNAIQEASGRPLNVIIPEELGETKIPALKMKDVNVEQLFLALTAASRKRERVYKPGTGEYDIFTTEYGFHLTPRMGGGISDETIWTFYVEKPAIREPLQPVKQCRFYALAPYLNGGLTVDDITTAIKTAAKMLGKGTGPDISFHKDTKLLIAVGEPINLEIIDSALRALSSSLEHTRIIDKPTNKAARASEPGPESK